MTVPAPASSAFYIRFAPDRVPDARTVLDFLAQNTDAARICTVTHRPANSDDWLELLASGLTFELCGLAGAGAMPQVDLRYGVAAQDDLSASGWLCLTPGGHLSGGRGQLPVVRVMAGLALTLLDLPGALGVAWAPARTIMSAEHFRRIIPGWLKGGAFPALGLTGLARDSSGALKTCGLHFFAGLELRIDPLLAQQPGIAGKIAVRLIHSFVGGWTVDEPVEVEGPEGEILRVYPEENGKILRVCRKS